MSAFLPREKLKEILAQSLVAYLPLAEDSIGRNIHMNALRSRPTPGALEPWAGPWLQLFVDTCVTDHDESRVLLRDLARSLPKVAGAFRLLFVCPCPDRDLSEALLVDFVNYLFGSRWCLDLGLYTSDLRPLRS